jgi:hypothetical protein
MFQIHEVRKAVSTAEAALLLNRKPQTLRKWACHENGLSAQFVLMGV